MFANAKGLQMFMIIFELEVTPLTFSSGCSGGMQTGTPGLLDDGDGST